MLKESQRQRKEMTLSQPSASQAPALYMGWLATTPTTRPPMRVSAVMMARPKRALSSKITPPSARRSMTRRMS